MLVAESVDRLGGPLAALLGIQRHRADDEAVALLARGPSHGEVAVALQLGLELCEAHAGLLIALGVDDDLKRVGGAAREITLERDEALLAYRVVGEARCTGCPELQAEHGSGGEQQQSDGEDEAEGWATHHRPHGPAPETALASGRGRDALAEPGDRQLVDAVAEHHQQRRMEGQRNRNRDDRDYDRAQREAAQDVVRNEEHAEQGERERRAAEDDGPGGGAGHVQDRLGMGDSTGPLLAQARDDEERVVDPQRQSHRHEHVDDEDVHVEELTDHRDQAEGDDDRDQGHQQRDRHPNHGADDQQQDDQRRRQPELELTLLKVLLCELLEIAGDGELAGDVDGEPVGAIGPRRDLEDLVDVVLGLLGEDERDDRRVLVGGDEDLAAGLEVACYLLDAAALLRLLDQAPDSVLECGVGDRVALRADD